MKALATNNRRDAKAERLELRTIGYYALAAGSVELEAAAARVKRGVPVIPIPVILLARLAVDASEQRRGPGAALLKDALTRMASAAGEIGVRAVPVHAKDDDAKAFDRRYDFDRLRLIHYICSYS